MVSDWYLVTLEALQNLWQGFLNFMPNLVGAIVVLVIGWFIAGGVGKLAAKILEKLRINQFFEKAGWRDALEKAEIKVDVAGFIGAIFKWVLFIVFLLAAVEILGLTQFADFLTSVLNYLPNVVVAALIFVVAVIIADIVEKIARASVEGARIGYGHIVGVIVKWSIWVFAILAIFVQLKVAPSLMQTLFTGLVALLVIGGGLAFGLGGKEIAGEILRDLQRKFKGEREE
jgi:small-conductance mechanosensitive channel